MTTRKKPQAKKPPQATALQNTAIRKWKNLHQQQAAIKPQIDAVRANLLSQIQKARTGDELESKYGTLRIETRQVLDMAELKRRLIEGGFIGELPLESLIEQSMKETDPYVAAPRTWSAEVKRAAELEAA